MSAGQPYDPTNPLYYDQFFKLDYGLSECERNQFDDYIGEYIAMSSHTVMVYLMTKYDPKPIFGEDEVKSYEIPPFPMKLQFEVTEEDKNIGAFEKDGSIELLFGYAHITTVKASIRSALIDAGLLEDDTLIDESTMSKEQLHRLELQEGDIIKVPFSNIIYEIDSLKTNEHNHLWSRFTYTITGRPRLATSADMGVVPEVEDADDIQEQHAEDITNEADVILF